MEKSFKQTAYEDFINRHTTGITNQQIIRNIGINLNNLKIAVKNREVDLDLAARWADDPPAAASIPCVHHRWRRYFPLTRGKASRETARSHRVKLTIDN